MTIAFGTEKIENQLSSKYAMEKAFGLRAKKISLRLDEIEDVENLKDLMTLPAVRCRQVSNNPADHWAIEIFTNFSLFFVIDHDPIPLCKDGFVNAKEVTRIRLIGFFRY